MKALFFFLSIIITSNAYSSTLDEALAKSTQLKLSENQEWLRLVHYRRSIWGGWTSEADNPDFFAAADGRQNPENELRETIKLIFNSKPRVFHNKQFPQETGTCQYPARWNWLAQHLDLSQTQNPSQCANYQKFVERASARSATLIFSSFYVNNPSSAFGHSLLRLNRGLKADGRPSSELLDLGVNYAANPTTSNPLLYSLYGLIGVFPGTFAALPYYYKVREYNDFEARDLWEYNLDLSKDEMKQMVAHIWELGFAQFDYYFLTENCAYHMLTLLEVAAPRLNLVNQIPFWVIPSDTIQVVNQSPQLIQSIEYRPSLNTQLQNRLQMLRQHNLVKVYHQVSQNYDLSQIPETLSLSDQALLLDAIIDQFDIQHMSALNQGDKEAKKKKHQILVKRSRLDAPDSLKIPFPKDKRPDLAHGSSRTSLGHTVNVKSGGQGFELSHRFALHDFLDPLDGYPATFKISSFNFILSGDYRSQQVFLRQFDLADVQSLRPINSIQTPLSWRVRLGATRVMDQRCLDGCTASEILGASGLSFDLFDNSRLTFYTLAAFSGKTSPSFDQSKWTLEAGPLTGIRMVLTPQFLIFSESSWLWSMGQDLLIHRTDARIRWSPQKSWALEVGFRNEFRIQQALAHLYFYY